MEEYRKKKNQMTDRHSDDESNSWAEELSESAVEEDEYYGEEGEDYGAEVDAKEVDNEASQLF